MDGSPALAAPLQQEDHVIHFVLTLVTFFRFVSTCELAKWVEPNQGSLVLWPSHHTLIGVSLAQTRLNSYAIVCIWVDPAMRIHRVCFLSVNFSDGFRSW